jgi:CRP-like cAMP-binding protein
MSYIDHLKSSGFFRDFKEEYLLKIDNICIEKSYQPQDYIFEEGQEAKKFYVLIEGSIAIQIRLKKHQSVVVGTTDEYGEIFGWSSLVEPKIYSSGVKCLEKTKVLSLCSDELEKLFNADPVMGLAFMKKIAGLIDKSLSTIRSRLLISIS